MATHPELAAASLDDLVGESAEMQQTIKRYEAAKTMVDAAIKAKMIEAGLQVGMAYVRPDGIGATLQTKVTKGKLDPLKLVSRGVPVDVIQDCTDPDKVSAPFVVVRVPKPGDKKDQE